jgi:hypothetical protein
MSPAQVRNHRHDVGPALCPAADVSGHDEVEGKDNLRDIRMTREGRSVFRRLTRLHVGVIAGAAIMMGMILVPTSGMASAAQAAPQSAVVLSAGDPAPLINSGNNWALDGRENCCGGVHMAPQGSDPGTQTWTPEVTASGFYWLVDGGNGWCLDGRENGSGGVHMAPCGSDPNTQEWMILTNSNGTFTLYNLGNGWELDGRENCCGGVHMAPDGSDPTTQTWSV